jgi:far upstream element-binding protein
MSDKGSPVADPADDKDPEEEVPSSKSDAESSGTSKRKREDDDDEDQSTDYNNNGEGSKRAKESESPQNYESSSLATHAATSSASTGIPPDYKTTIKTHGAVTIISHISPANDNEIIEISQEKVGQIIGTKGAVIQDMQVRTGAKIFVKQDFPAGVNRQVTISGTPAQVKTAGDLVRLIIENGPTAIHVNSMSGGPLLHVVIDCAQALVGRVIGASGSTIKELQSRTGAKIQIDQNFPEGAPRKINVSGTQAAINMATQLISYVMENGPTLPPLPGQVPPMMGGGAGAGMGMYGPPPGSVHTVGAGAGGVQHQVMECAKAFVGKIIGRGGETINMIQQKSGTFHFFVSHFPSYFFSPYVLSAFVEFLLIVPW